VPLAPQAHSRPAPLRSPRIIPALLAKSSTGRPAPQLAAQPLQRLLPYHGHLGAWVHVPMNHPPYPADPSISATSTAHWVAHPQKKDCGLQIEKPLPPPFQSKIRNPKSQI
jgi:hypothetical protein